MKMLAELALRYAGRSIVAMAGGPSLPEHVGRCPADALYLSANQHGVMLRGADFIVCIDDIEARLRPFGVPIIGTRYWCDYRIHKRRIAANSGMLAIWVGWVLGGHPVIVAGMDCYQGGTYWHDAVARSSSAGLSQSYFDLRLGLLCRQLNGASIRSCGGPTSRFFPAWDPAEVLPAFTPAPQLLAMRAQVPWRVRITAGTARLGSSRAPKGITVDVTAAEGGRLLRERKATRVAYRIRAAARRRHRACRRRRMRW